MIILYFRNKVLMRTGKFVSFVYKADHTETKLGEKSDAILLLLKPKFGENLEFK